MAMILPTQTYEKPAGNPWRALQVVTYLDWYRRLLEEVWDGKIKPGFNHMEANVHKALQDTSTITELAAMSLYGISVSWPYLAAVRGNGVRNLLDADLIELHRKLLGFCDAIAAHPFLLLDQEISDFSKVTLDGKPWMDNQAIMAIRVLFQISMLQSQLCFLALLLAGNNSRKSFLSAVHLTHSQLNNARIFSSQLRMMQTKVLLALGV